MLNCWTSHLTKKELIEISNKLKNGKASGLDSISNEMIKSFLKCHSDSFVNLFNKLLIFGYFPQCWNDGYISPIYKSGETTDPNNYRGITINSCLGKFFTLLLNSRSTNFLDSNNIIKPNQIGFRKSFRTADRIFVLKTILDSYFKDKKKLYVCFVDFKKASDSVWRNGHFFKLINCGISKTFNNSCIIMLGPVLKLAMG